MPRFLLPTLASCLLAVAAASAQIPCGEDDVTLCFQGDRVAVTVTWTDPRTGVESQGHARPLGQDTGAFWFFDPGNLEVVVKVLDGTGINQSLWAFLASLSDLEMTVRVEDRATGLHHDYYNAPGNRWGIVDIEGFRQDGVGRGGVCGGFPPPGTPFQCAPGLFCEDEPGQCSLFVDGTGTCADLPEACTTEFAPVCGCDGSTYSNDCARRAAGVSKLHDGACETDARICGGIAGFPCDDEGEVCKFESGMCQVADLAGVCVARPEACVAVFAPVCGCDGRTYSNDCELLRAGVAKATDGACP